MGEGGLNARMFMLVQAVTRIVLLSCILLVSLPGNLAALHSLTLGKASYVKKRSRIIFLFITLADCLVTLFPIAGQLIWEAVLSLLNFNPMNLFFCCAATLYTTLCVFIFIFFFECPCSGNFFT